MLKTYGEMMRLGSNNFWSFSNPGDGTEGGWDPGDVVRWGHEGSGGVPVAGGNCNWSSGNDVTMTSSGGVGLEKNLQKLYIILRK